MDRRPLPTRKRRAYEVAIRVVDIVVYTAVFAGGVYALVAPPGSVVASLAGYEWLAAIWAILLATGGLVGLLGRVSGYWLIETPATIASATGILIYTVILGQHVFSSITAVVATTLVIVAFGFMVRRWLELQLFSFEPGAPWQAKLLETLQRRTGNVVHRSSP